jgi:hypothetical protein
MHPVARCLVLVSASAIALVRGVALADPLDPAAAESLFRQGRVSADAGDYPRACAAFAESLRLEPAPGTLLNLADCEEHVGLLASAWENFLRLASILPTTDERLEIARARAGALLPRVPRLVVVLSPGTYREARVFRDDVEIDGPGLAVPWPVDPGWHSVLVVAPGYEPRTMAVVARESETSRVVVAPGPVVPHDVVRPSPSHTIAWVVGAAGIASLGVGTYFGARALAERSVSDGGCTGGTCANATALGAYESARSDARVSDVALGLGVLMLATGGYLLFVAGRGTRADVALRATAMGVGGAW